MHFTSCYMHSTLVFTLRISGSFSSWLLVFCHSFVTELIFPQAQWHRAMSMPVIYKVMMDSNSTLVASSHTDTAAIMSQGPVTQGLYLVPKHSYLEILLRVDINKTRKVNYRLQTSDSSNLCWWWQLMLTLFSCDSKLGDIASFPSLNHVQK